MPAFKSCFFVCYTVLDHTSKPLAENVDYGNKSEAFVEEDGISCLRPYQADPTTRQQIFLCQGQLACLIALRNRFQSARIRRIPHRKCLAIDGPKFHARSEPSASRFLLQATESTLLRQYSCFPRVGPSSISRGGSVRSAAKTPTS